MNAAIHLVTGRVTFESDCANLIRAIKGNSMSAASRMIIEEIRDLYCQNFISVDICFVTVS